MLMMMPPYHGATLRADDKGMLEHFAQVAEAAGLPIMYQDAPLSGANVSVAFLVRLAREVPAVRYFKIEVPGSAGKLRSPDRVRAATRSPGPFDGEESITLMADLDAGATGTMPSALLPDLIKPVVEHHRAGRRAEAAAAYARILPLINFENRQCGLRATKTVMAEGGVIKSDAVRHPLEALHPRDTGRPAGARARSRSARAALGPLTNARQGTPSAAAQPISISRVVQPTRHDRCAG
jgi:dihydrodipicolinate synthase/N-acetylneuraminate lyase